MADAWWYSFVSCVSPLKAFWTSRSRDSITFDLNKSATRISFALPCGRCIGCRMEKARQWGLRCVHEAKAWPANFFVTLTYSDEFLPPGGTVCLRDVQLFMKRLRKAKNSSASNPVRFFLGAEYGDVNLRPHYHALLFNVDFPDRVFLAHNERGDPVFTSGELSRLWSADGGKTTLGFCSLGAVTFESAVYCAKYALKKLTVSDSSPPEIRDRYEQRYIVYDADGIVHERAREFAIMSRRPGIGSYYYDKYHEELLAHDSVVVDGKEVKPPRFYDLRSDARSADRFAQLKAIRKRQAVLNRGDNTPERLRVKETLLTIAATQKERKL
ncbi:replication initiator protein [Blackfly microvirus SF02]|uniref:Replication initiator protein n=1 Tax=Blackfly microvirus SF02 TaxID=2576452 RepID=A0A4P8PK63_9VIRU|nr:replication initiator protein [Blackfly microvirus SF02]